MPVSLDAGKPISLIFEFHDSFAFEAGEVPSNPIASIGTSDPWIAYAIKENCIICYPAGEVNYNQDGSGAVGWQHSEDHLPFVDAMMDYFKSCTPLVDMNRVYATGQLSGGIFSFILALERSEVFASIVPRAAQFNLDEWSGMSSRAVPVRVFAGENDVAVTDIVSSMVRWAEKIGGYFASDMQTDSLDIEEYCHAKILGWHGANTDLEIYSLEGVEQNVSLYYCLPHIWEFMNAHPLNEQASNLYITASLKEIVAKCGETFVFDINYTDGGSVEMIYAPDGWNAILTGKTVTLTGPEDFYGNIDRSGEIIFAITKDGETASTTVKYKLEAPKDYFEVGDVCYNNDFEPVGVVCWVNKANIREAKIINLQEITTQGVYENSYFGDFGSDFATSDREDGESNTALCVAENVEKDLGLSALNSGLMWAASYEYKGVDSWYLPAIEEWIAVYNSKEIIDETIAALGGRTLRTSGSYMSSTVTLENEIKTFYRLNTATGTETLATRESYNYARAMKKVTR